MSGRRASAGWAATLVLAGAVGVACDAPRGPAPAAAPAAPATAAPEREDAIDAAAAPEPLRRTTVRLYFPAAAADGLVAEAREIFDTAAPGDRIKQIINDLIAGPATSEALAILSRDVRLRQAYVLDDGVAYLDFTSDLTRSAHGGSTQEMLTVYAIVDSVVLNVPEAREVVFLVEGQPTDTLAGHVDLRRPLGADRDLIVGAAAGT